jgi:hypothetical protein
MAAELLLSSNYIGGISLIHHPLAGGKASGIEQPERLAQFWRRQDAQFGLRYGSMMAYYVSILMCFACWDI